MSERFTCFHCRETFRSHAAAQAHFGTDENSKPACILKAERPLIETLRLIEDNADGIVFNLGENGPTDPEQRFDRVWHAAWRILDALRPYRDGTKALAAALEPDE